MGDEGELIMDWAAFNLWLIRLAERVVALEKWRKSTEERLVEIKKEKGVSTVAAELVPVKLMERAPKLTPTVAVKRGEEAPKIGSSAWLRAKTSDSTAIAPGSSKSQEQRIRDALKKREKRAREKAERGVK